MGQIRQARWAPSVPWSGVYDKPAFLSGPDGTITIADVQGLAAALAALQPRAGLARVAYTGRYSDLSGLPALGSAAYASVSDFTMAPTGKTLQVGSIALVAGQQSYPVVFTRAMSAIPKIRLQHFMATDSDGIFFAAPQDDSITVNGFTFWLNGIPVTSTGRVEYWCQVQDQPA